MITVCVPVLKRYDLLSDLVKSLNNSSVPTTLSVIDNGRNDQKMRSVITLHNGANSVYTPNRPMGVAESWNWFIQNVPEERLITNDDIVFSSDSLAKMIASRAPFVSCSFGFSCFILRDECVKAVGLFDETISPGYAYFEDMDYLRRMKIAGIQDEVVLCDVVHHQSQTSAQFTDEEWKTHHQKFTLAQNNYETKWQGKPSWDQLAVIGGAGANA